MGQGSGRLSDNDKLNVRATCPKGRLESTVVLSYKSMVLDLALKEQYTCYYNSFY